MYGKKSAVEEVFISVAGWLHIVWNISVATRVVGISVDLPVMSKRVCISVAMFVCSSNSVAYDDVLNSLHNFMVPI